MSKLTIAVQKSGRLSEQSLSLFQECGIDIANSNRKLKASATNFPLEILFLRDDDIPQYVEQGVADAGILGENEIWEQQKEIRTVRRLGFASCRMSLAIPKDEAYENLGFFEGKKIATSYPGILRRFFEKENIPVTIEPIGGSVEIAPGIGLAEGIFDIVSTGSTLQMNGLKEVAVVARSQAALVSNTNLSAPKQALLDALCFRLEAVRAARCNKYILLNAPNAAIADITAILPGMKAPTVLPLALEGWSSLHSVVPEDAFWDIIDRLKEAGAEGILVVPIEKMIL